DERRYCLVERAQESHAPLEMPHLVADFLSPDGKATYRHDEQDTSVRKERQAHTVRDLSPKRSEVKRGRSAQRDQSELPVRECAGFVGVEELAGGEQQEDTRCEQHRGCNGEPLRQGISKKRDSARRRCLCARRGGSAHSRDVVRGERR